MSAARTDQGAPLEVINICDSDSDSPCPTIAGVGRSAPVNTDGDHGVKTESWTSTSSALDDSWHPRKKRRLDDGSFNAATRVLPSAGTAFSNISSSSSGPASAFTSHLSLSSAKATGVTVPCVWGGVTKDIKTPLLNPIFKPSGFRPPIRPPPPLTPADSAVVVASVIPPSTEPSSSVVAAPAPLSSATAFPQFVSGVVKNDLRGLEHPSSSQQLRAAINIPTLTKEALLPKATAPDGQETTTLLERFQSSNSTIPKVSPETQLADVKVPQAIGCSMRQDWSEVSRNKMPEASVSEAARASEAKAPDVKTNDDIAYAKSPLGEDLWSCQSAQIMLKDRALHGIRLNGLQLAAMRDILKSNLDTRTNLAKYYTALHAATRVPATGSTYSPRLSLSAAAKAASPVAAPSPGANSSTSKGITPASNPPASARTTSIAKRPRSPSPIVNDVPRSAKLTNNPEIENNHIPPLPFHSRSILDTPIIGTGLREIHSKDSVSSDNAATQQEEKLAGLMRAMESLNILFGAPWQPEEDALLIYLKEELEAPWTKIGTYFKHRGGWQTCQARYSSKLKNRKRPPTTAPASSVATIQRDSTQQDSQAASDIQEARESRPRRTLTEVPKLYAPPNYFDRFQIGQEGGTSASSDPITSSTHISSNTQTSVAPLLFSAVRKRVQVAKNRMLNESVRDDCALTSSLLRLRLRPMPLSTRNGVKSKKRRSIEFHRPYLGKLEREWLHNSNHQDIWTEEADSPWTWTSTILHVDYTEVELQALRDFLLEMTKANGQKLWSKQVIIPDGLTVREEIAALLTVGCRQSVDLIERRIGHLSRRYQTTSYNLNRNETSLHQFLRDCTAEPKPEEHAQPQVHRLRPISQQRPSTHRNLRRRELGLYSTSKAATYQNLGPLLHRNGASGDINAVAWSPNGSMFAAGAAATTDMHSQQYNREINLYLGDVHSKKLWGLPDHTTQRKLTPTGPNAHDIMLEYEGPLLYQSVSNVAFSPNAMYSTGFDKVTRVYDVRRGPENIELKWALGHHSRVTQLAVNSERGLFATGRAIATRSIRIFREDLDTTDVTKVQVGAYTPPRATGRSDIVPTSMKWGSTIWEQSKYLLVGFGSTREERQFKEGEVCLWDAEAEHMTEVIARGTREVFDIQWSPSIFGRFVVASTSTSYVNRGTRSVIQLYDSTNLNPGIAVDSQHTQELECPASDINEVIFNPADENLVSAACTNGIVYVWDLRNHGKIINRFQHGEPLMEKDPFRAREDYDTGVRFLHWDATRRHLISGSSDGVVAKWDPYVDSQDAHIENIANLESGVMSGAYNNEYSSLLLGEVTGALNVLAVGRDEDDEFDHFEFVEPSSERMAFVYETLGITRPHEETAAELANKLLSTKQVEIKPAGSLPRRQAVQGPAYEGPFRTNEDAKEIYGRQKAQDWQQSLRAENIDRCLPCFANLSLTSSEDQGDNGNSKTRIPGNVRFKVGGATNNSIGCIRCGKAMVPGPADQCWCASCKMTWRRDLLGYSPVNGLASRPMTPVGHESLAFSEYSSDEEKIDDFEAAKEERVNLQNLVEYHHSFWGHGLND